jgi:hypothetical protein
MNFLAKLQSTDESTKKKWLILITVVSMMIVVSVWLKYFNNLVIGVNNNPTVDGGSGFSFFETMKEGTAFLYDSLAQKMTGLGEVLNAPRNYIVSPPK